MEMPKNEILDMSEAIPPVHTPKPNKNAIMNMVGAALAVGATAQIEIEGHKYTVHKLTPQEKAIRDKKRVKRKASTKARKHTRKS